jgi:transcriptional regulator with XRE-family HTH domain
MAFTENLRRLRLERFLSQAELARRAGLHALTITRLEGGATAPSTRTVRALAGALAVEPRRLAAPDEVAELRRLLRDGTQAEPSVGDRQDTWDDDGGAPKPGGRAAMTVVLTKRGGECA